MIIVTYDSGYETVEKAEYRGSTFHVDESGVLFIQEKSTYVAAYGKNVWRTVNEL